MHAYQNSQFIPSCPISLRLILILFFHLYLGLPSGLFSSDFTTKNMDILSPYYRASCHFNLILLDFIVCSLFNDTFSMTRAVNVEWISNTWVISWKGCGWKRLWPNFNVISQHLHGSTEENHWKPRLGYPVSGPWFEPRTSRIRSRVLPTRPRRSLWFYYNLCNFFTLLSHKPS
jgi:hypothetical protein